MSKAGKKAYVYIDFNEWVGGGKHSIAWYDKSETELSIFQLVCLLSEFFK